MAIDYRVEWKKLHDKHGTKNIRMAGELHKLYEVMNRQINETIDKREVLMKEYLKTGIETDITGGNQHCHFVSIRFYKNTYGNICVSKKDFAAWCEEKGDN